MGDTMERCRILLDDMTLNPFSEWFREPVDHENMGLTDYLQVIKEPQDLGTISKKLERNHYMSPEDYGRDVRLVWQNEITYNSATSMFGVVAAILWQTFDRRFALITNLASVDPGRPIPDRAGWPSFLQKKKVLRPVHEADPGSPEPDGQLGATNVRGGCAELRRQGGFQQGDGVGPTEDEVGEERELTAARLCSRLAQIDFSGELHAPEFYWRTCTPLAKKHGFVQHHRMYPPQRPVVANSVLRLTARVGCSS